MKALRSWLASLAECCGIDLSPTPPVRVTVRENGFGGWSLFAANDTAADLFGGLEEPTGNWPTETDARRVAIDQNCWEVVPTAAEQLTADAAARCMDPHPWEVMS